MIAALFYLQYQSSRNRLITRFKRLKQPKYLIGAIAGGLYFYFYFFRYLFLGNSHSRHAVNLTLSPEHAQLIESLGAFVLFVIVLLAWLLPHERAALTFTEAEVAFLFPAPVSRRTLVHFKLMRSQLRIFFSALFLTLLSHRVSGGNILTHAFSWWLILSILDLHLLGSSFARTLLLDRGISNWLRRLLVFALTAGAAIGVWLWAKKTLPPLTVADTGDFNSILNYAGQVLGNGPALYLLYPFRLVIQPFLAPDTAAFFSVLVPALLVFLLHYLWVIFADVSFEEASLAASQKAAARLTAIRAGNWQGLKKNQKAKRAWFQLAPTGPPYLALLWKNLIATGQIFSARILIVMAVVITVFIVALSGDTRMKNLSVMADIIVAIILGYSLLIGPQFLRLDFRRDLPQADILKTFPLPGWQIALGEILAPVVLLAGFQWLLLFIGTALIFYLPAAYHTLCFTIAFGALFALPVMDFILLLIPNAAVLLFPSWIQTGKDSPRGIESTGQRLVFAVGQLLVLVLALVPAALAFAAVYFSLKFVLGSTMPIFFAVPVAIVILGVEAGFGVMLLGKLFEKFNVAEEPVS